MCFTLYMYIVWLYCLQTAKPCSNSYVLCVCFARSSGCFGSGLPPPTQRHPQKRPQRSEVSSLHAAGVVRGAVCQGWLRRDTACAFGKLDLPDTAEFQG